MNVKTLIAVALATCAFASPSFASDPTDADTTGSEATSSESTSSATAGSSRTTKDGEQDVKPLKEIAGKRVGDLTCNVDGGWGLLVGSSKTANCTFKRVDGTTENYAGQLRKIGLDIGKTENAYMAWAVFTRDDYEVTKGMVSGTYASFSAEAALGIGLGANALIGGTDKNIGLQPFLREKVTGYNLAVGLATLDLKVVK